MTIDIRGVRKKFGTFEGLKGVDLSIPSGELVALLGPSGSGKTTLLRILSGLDVPDQGSVHFHGKDATDVSVRDREVGFVFQHYALFRHMTLFDNIAYGLRVKPKSRRPTDSEIKDKVNELLKLVQLDWLGDRYPGQLSGGQRQRIALARALAVEPKVLLLDEPFGALDAKVRVELRHWLRRLHDDLAITSVFVTHDQEEALEVSDRVVILNEGRIEQVGTPEEVYENPANPFVYEFLGLANVFQGDLRQDVLAAGYDVRINSEGSHSGGEAHAYVRPYDFEISLDAPAEKFVRATLRHAQVLGKIVRLECEALSLEKPLRVELEKRHFRELGISSGSVLYLRPKHVQVFLKDRNPG